MTVIALTAEQVGYLRSTLRAVACRLSDDELDLLCRLITQKAINTGGSDQQDLGTILEWATAVALK